MKLRLLLVDVSPPGPCGSDTVHSAAFRAAVEALEVYDTEIEIVGHEGRRSRPGQVHSDAGAFRMHVSASLPFDAALVIISADPWSCGAQEAVEILKGLSPRSPVIICGDHPDSWYDQAAKTSGADYIHRGPLVSECAFVFRTFGFRLRKKRGQTR